MSPDLTPQHGMQCMEIWGGNRPADSAVRTPGLDFHVISKPLDGAGGDVHYVSLCGGGMTTRILLADVAGHGTEVAELATDLRKLIRKFINTKSQKRLVGQLNNRLEQWSTDGRYATSIVATYLANKRQLTYCNAGHPRPLFYSQKTGTWELLNTNCTQPENPSDLPLGMIKGIAYSQDSIQLETGDRVLFYTDFLIEAHDRTGNARGEEGLLNTIRKIAVGSEAVAKQLLEEILSNTSDDSPTDDITILEFQHNGEGVKPPGIAEKVKVYGKFFGLLPV
jgi:serine phosphatase RsbU (regulator of sigma subunit)